MYIIHKDRWVEINPQPKKEEKRNPIYADMQHEVNRIVNRDSNLRKKLHIKSRP